MLLRLLQVELFNYPIFHKSHVQILAQPSQFQDDFLLDSDTGILVDDHKLLEEELLLALRGHVGREFREELDGGDFVFLVVAVGQGICEFNDAFLLLDIEFVSQLRDDVAAFFLDLGEE